MATGEQQSKDYSRRHPAYNAMVTRWEMAFDFLRGGKYVRQPGHAVQELRFGQFKGAEMAAETDTGAERSISRFDVGAPEPWNSYLWKHETEGSSEFAKRSEQVWHMPLFGPMINEVVADLLRHPPDREKLDADARWREFWENVDDADTNIDAFIRHIVSRGLCFGRMHVLTDRTPVDEPPASAYHARVQGQRAYLQAVTPFELINWRRNERGEYVWAVIREDLPDCREPGDPWPERESLGLQRERYQYRIWDTEKWTLYRHGKGDGSSSASKSFEAVATADHGMGYVPLRDVFFQIVGAPRVMDCESPFASQLDLDRHLLNEVSELWVAERLYSFPMLAIPELEGEVGEPVDLKPTRAWGYPAGSGLPAPSYITPDQAPMNDRWARVKDKYLYGRMTAGVGRGMQERSIERRSADALVEEMRTHLSQMAQWIAAVQELDHQINADAARAHGWTGAVPRASYVRSFYRTAILAAVNVINQLSALGVLTPRLVSMLVKPVVSAFLVEQGADAETLQSADVELQLAASAAQQEPPAAPEAVQ